MYDFSKKYDKKEFETFLHEFLPDDASFVDKDLKLDDTFKYFTRSTLVAEVNSLENLKIIEIEHNASEKSRVTISRDLFRLLSLFAYSHALIITYCKQEENYRFSLITSTLEWSTNKKIKEKFSNPKRLSFLLGEGAKLHTPHNKLNAKVLNYEDLFSRFNIEIVNDEFFENYKKLFINLQNKIEKDSIFNKFLKDKNITSDFFFKKIIRSNCFLLFFTKKKMARS